MTNKTVSAIFTSSDAAESAIEALKTNGYREEELSIIAAESSIKDSVRGPKGAKIGAGVGGVVGAAVAGVTAAVTLTGGAALLAAGPLVAALAGAGAGAASGGFVGSLVGLGMPETRAKMVDERLGLGNVLLGVTVDEAREEKTKEILNKSGAEDVSIHS